MQYKTIQDNARQDKPRQYNTLQDKTSQCNASQ